MGIDSAPLNESTVVIALTKIEQINVNNQNFYSLRSPTNRVKAISYNQAKCDTKIHS